MTDYIITPHKKDIPSSHLLSEEMHRRALSVEMEVKGTNYKWESIHFYDPVLPETQCFIERNLHSHVFKVSLAPNSEHESAEMQAALVDIILHEVGGSVYDPELKESYDLKGFRTQSKQISSSEYDFEDAEKSSPNQTPLSAQDLLWVVFSWALVLAGVYAYFHAPDSRKVFILIADVLALISAGGLTFSITKTK